MRILYGVQSTGNGHITRSSKIIYKLIKSGCEVDVLMSGNNSQVKFNFPVKYQLTGFTFYYTDKGKVDYFKTFYNLSFLQFLKDIRLDISSYDLIISDFEPITAWASKLKERECIGISNQCSFLSDKTPRPDNKRYLGEFLLKNIAPVSKPIGLHFEKYDDFIFTPIIKEIFTKIPTRDYGHYTVYLPTHKLEKLIYTFVEMKGVKFEIYSNVKRDMWVKNCLIKKIQRDSFEESLRNCHGVITAAGFQTPSEALYLGKKLMVIPIKGQYEQECNAESLKRMGVFTGDINNIHQFLFDTNIVKVDWKDSSDEIIKIILSH
jgi:uncharacterized protein (TIGR00661 family)